jgi:hypothetical protein
LICSVFDFLVQGFSVYSFWFAHEVPAPGPADPFIAIHT